jgi:outer membrane immunogenic protein
MAGYGSENTNDRFAIKGGFGGGTVGYNWQFGQFAAGIEGDRAFADINNSVTQVFPGLGTLTASAKVDAQAPRSAGSGLGVNHCKTMTGWTAGAGVEWMFLPHWSAKGEYLYRSFSSQTFVAAQLPPDSRAER